MANKQLFAKIGVFLLLVLNVAAYWFFWPNYRGAANAGKGAAQDKGEVRLLPASTDKDQKPREIPPALQTGAVPLSIPASATQDDSKKDPVSLLIDRIEKDKALDQKKGVLSGKPADPSKAGEPTIKLPPFDPLAPGKLPPLESKGLVLPPFDNAKPIEYKDVGVTAPLTPKAVSPWMVKTETFGNRKQLTAVLQPVNVLKPVAEFRIQCDHVESKPGQPIVAHGNVVFLAGTLRGECQSATLMLLEPTVVFQGRVQIADPTATGHSFRADQVTWSPVGNGGELFPAGLGKPN